MGTNSIPLTVRQYDALRRERDMLVWEQTKQMELSWEAANAISESYYVRIEDRWQTRQRELLRHLQIINDRNE